MTTGTHAGHGHGHGHEDDWDWDLAGDRLENEAEVSLELFDAVATWLSGLVERPVRDVLDVGSGPGVATAVFAAVFADATVTALDGSAALLQRATARAERLGVGDRVVLRHGELPDALDTLGPADLIWASRVVHHVGDQADALARMAALLRPGGVLAIAEGGLSMRSLPGDIGIGRPGLSQRMEAALNDWFVEMRAAQPGSTAVVEDWRGLLAGAGLTPCGTKSFLTDRPAPVDDATRAVIVEDWVMRAERAAPLLSDDDRATLARLLDPADEASLHHRPDVFALSASTVYAARAA